MNSKNIHALMSDSAYSVHVRFITDQGGATRGKVYEYVTNIPGIKVGDYAVVMAPNFNNPMDADDEGSDRLLPKTVMVVAVDDGISFDPQETKTVNWLVQRVDFTAYAAAQSEVHAAAESLKKAQRARMREVFKQQMLQELAAPSNQAKE